MASTSRKGPLRIRRSEPRIDASPLPRQGFSEGLVEMRKRIEAIGCELELCDLVRYRDPETGKTWCGFGRPPNWIRGADRERFRVR